MASDQKTDRPRPPRCQCKTCGRFIGCIHTDDNRIPCAKCDPDAKLYIKGQESVQFCQRCWDVILEEERIDRMPW